MRISDWSSDVCSSDLLADEIEGDDVSVEQDGVKLVVDAVCLDLVLGSAVDFVEDLGGSAFKVTNPNAASDCGCGFSFLVSDLLLDTRHSVTSEIRLQIRTASCRE